MNQPENGYRFTSDPFLLCSQIGPPDHATILDIGCGCGIIALILALKNPTVKISGVEIQEELAAFADENVKTNGLTGTVTILCKDFRAMEKSDFNGPIDLIVTNPPYKKKTTGRTNPDSGKAVARHEITLCLEALLEKSGDLLRTKGNFFIIFPAGRIHELLSGMVQNRIQPDTIRFVHTKKESSAGRVIVSGIKDGAQYPRVSPPLYVPASL